MSTEQPKLLSFASPKGGVGRTMTAANIGIIYASGCTWANLRRRRTLLVDMDLEAPGIHYYDFATAIAIAQGLPSCSYRARGEHFQSLSSLHQWIRTQRDFGLLFWLSAVVENQKLDRVISEFRGARRGKVMPSSILISNVITTLFELIDAARGSVFDPSQHAIEVIDDNKTPLMYLLPPGDPNQGTYQETLKRFVWSQFFEERAGFAVLSTLYSWFLKEREGGHFGVERILLDQDAGDSWPSEANRRVAHNRILVTGLNLQNQEGLLNLFGSSDQPFEFADVRVVLSQYKGRPIEPLDGSEPVSGAAMHPVISREAFLEAEKQRTNAVNLLTRKKGVDVANIFLVDFLVKAVQQEYFHQVGSPSWNELARLLVSIESSPHVRVERAGRYSFEQLRIVGEFVGVDNSHPSGPIGALRSWLQEECPGVSVSGIATGHEEIVALAREGSVKLGVSGDSAGTALNVMRAGTANDTKVFDLNYFDIVALPAYMIPHAFDRLEPLSLKGIVVETADRDGPIDLAYLQNSILGFEQYSTYQGTTLIGYPLFVDFELLVVNTKRVIENIDSQYFKNEQRRFRGFQDPADVLAAARAVKRDSTPRNQIIMTLKKHISQWYEWQTVVSLFGGIDVAVTDPWQDIANDDVIRLEAPETIRATRFYLELCSYAAHDSDTSDWDKAIRLFYEKESAGIAFMFPDAIPEQYRSLNSGRPFVYATPPCDLHPEECWLLVIPKNRREGAPSTKDLQELFVRFMSYESQKRYQFLGGMTTHRRALESVDLWQTSPYLAHLLSLSVNRQQSVFLRSAHSKSRHFAEQMVDALDNLRDFVKRELEKDSAGNTSSDFLWYKDDFVQKIEDAVRSSFSEIVKQLMKEQ